MSTTSSEPSGRTQRIDKRETRRLVRLLHDHVQANRLEDVHQLLSSNIDVDFPYRGQTALQIAVINGLDQMSTVLIQCGADINFCDTEQRSLLNIAVASGFIKVAQLLIQNGVDIEVTDQQGNSPLHICALNNAPEIAGLLCEAKCACNRPNLLGQTAVFIAASVGHSQVVEVLAKGGCDVNQVEQERKSPLIVASENGHHEVVKVLVEIGCDLNLQERYKCTALYSALSNNQTEAASLLVAAGADLTILSSKKVSPLLEAVRKCNLPIVRQLLDKGCNPNVCDYTEQAPIHAAVVKANQSSDSEAVDVITCLMEHGCDINLGDGKGWTPLHLCAFSGNVEVFLLLLYGGANIHAVTQTGESLLHSAVIGNKPEMVEILIQAGCSINHVNVNNELPLHCAVSSKAHIDILRMLVTHGSELDFRERGDKRTPFYMAVSNDYDEAARLLVQSGCNVNFPNSRFITPLSEACDTGNTSLVKLIVQQPGCKVNSGFERLPLHILVHRGYFKLVELLLDSGADINKVSNSGLTPVQVAIEDGNDEMLKLLIRWGCDLSASENSRVSPFFPMQCCKMYSDPHPHIELQPLFAAVKFEDVAMMSMLLTAYHRVPYKVVKTIHDIVTVGFVGGQRILSDRFKTRLMPLIKEVLQKPRSLQVLCRGTVRQVLKTKPFEKVKKLKIPSEIQSLILFEKELDLSTKVVEHCPYGEDEDSNWYLNDE